METPQRLIAVRHPRTDDADDRVYRGPRAAITDRGRQEADIVADRFIDLDIDVIVTSTYERATYLAQTIQKRCQITRKRPIEVIPSELFVECRKPTCTLGRERDHPDAVAAMEMHRLGFDDNVRHSDEETRADLEQRIDAGLSFIRSLKDERVVLVSHGKFESMMEHYIYMDGTLERFYRTADRHLRPPHHTGISIFSYGPDHRNPDESHWHIECWNDVAHTETFLSPNLLKALAGRT